MTPAGKVGMSGQTQHRVIRSLGELPPPPKFWALKNFLLHRRRHLIRQHSMSLLGSVLGTVTMQSALRAKVYRPDFSRLHPEQLLKVADLLRSSMDVRELARYFGGDVLDYGLISTRVVTTAGVNFIVDAFQNTTELENLKYHAYGTGTNAEAAGDTALQTEETTQYNPDNTRPTGTTTEGASANIYRTVATYSPDSGGTRAITEHGVLSQAATGGGTLLDRSVFSAINLVAGSDSLQTTYELTVSSGG